MLALLTSHDCWEELLRGIPSALHSLIKGIKGIHECLVISYSIFFKKCGTSGTVCGPPQACRGTRVVSCNHMGTSLQGKRPLNSICVCQEHTDNRSVSCCCCRLYIFLFWHRAADWHLAAASSPSRVLHVSCLAQVLCTVAAVHPMAMGV